MPSIQNLVLLAFCEYDAATTHDDCRHPYGLMHTDHHRVQYWMTAVGVRSDVEFAMFRVCNKGREEALVFAVHRVHCTQLEMR